MSLSGHETDGAFSRRNASAAEFGIAFVYNSSSSRLNSGTYFDQESALLDGPTFVRDSDAADDNAVDAASMSAIKVTIDLSRMNN